MAPQAQVNRYQDQPELAATISNDPTFSALEQEVAHERKTQAMKWWYTYVLTDEIAGHAHLFLQSDEGGYSNLSNSTHEVPAQA